MVQSQTISVKADQDSVLVKQPSDLEFTLNKLLADRDFKTYATYLADDYVRISANGEMKTKDQVLQEFLTSQPGEAFPEIRQIRIYGNTAIMNIRLTLTREVSGKKVTRESLLTKVFISRGGQWFMVSNQGTPLSRERTQQ
jgi:hypothetical protein